MGADERRELVLSAARSEFSARGLHGGSTNAIADAAGISQPYLFQLYRTKRELFTAVVDRYFDETSEALRDAADRAGKEDVFGALARGYLERLAADGEGLMLFMQALAASGDPEVQARVRERFGELYHYVERVSGANDEAVRTLFAYALLAALGAALGLKRTARGDSWSGRLMNFLESFEARAAHTGWGSLMLAGLAIARLYKWLRRGRKHLGEA
jgi:AcrR family transcriptional regulator